MSSSETAKQHQRAKKVVSTDTGESVLTSLRTNELFIGIVGPAGAGSGTAAKILRSFLEESDFVVEIVKASGLIRSMASRAGLEIPPKDARKSLATVKLMQDRGDELRQGEMYGLREDHSAVARLALREIARLRAKDQGMEFSGGPVEPDGKKRAFIIDSLRHPSEVHLLREVYKDAFSLIGIVCDPIKRAQRIRNNFFDRQDWGKSDTRDKVDEFLTRDEDAKERYGQHVANTFHEEDFFVDNSKEGKDDLAHTGMNDQLRRFVELITQSRIVRPTIAETAMHHARSAQMRSACLSRQVGASLVDSSGSIVATGTNDVPRAGGGLYGEDFTVAEVKDERCAFRGSVFCSSNREQNAIIAELLDQFPKLAEGRDRIELVEELRRTRIGGLIEFSRAVHAEMNAILSASISGISPKGCRMFVTTYPCHYCARHIVAAGIDEVQFIEPYPKSRATALHDDSVTTEFEEWVSPSEGGGLVLFRPFIGVAPRLYKRVFLKDRSYKDSVSGDFKLGEPQWGNPTEAYKVSYVSMENKLALDPTDE